MWARNIWKRGRGTWFRDLFNVNHENIFFWQTDGNAKLIHNQNIIFCFDAFSKRGQESVFLAPL
jgi:hypothetical protein